MESSAGENLGRWLRKRAVDEQKSRKEAHAAAVASATPAFRECFLQKLQETAPNERKQYTVNVKDCAGRNFVDYGTSDNNPILRDIAKEALGDFYSISCGYTICTAFPTHRKLK